MGVEKRLFSIIVLGETALLAILTLASPVQGQIIGLVCISRTMGAFSDTCPPNASFFAGPAGGVLSVAVNIRGSAGFHGFAISVKTDQRFLMPVSFGLTENVLNTLGIPIVVSSCVNGEGTACITDIDGPGVLSLTVAAPSGVTPTPTTGRLFSITYSIVAVPSGRLTAPIFFPGPCFGPFGTSVPDRCVTVFDTTLIPLPETIQTATFV